MRKESPRRSKLVPSTNARGVGSAPTLIPNKNSPSSRQQGYKCTDKKCRSPNTNRSGDKAKTNYCDQRSNYSGALHPANKKNLEGKSKSCMKSPSVPNVHQRLAPKIELVCCSHCSRTFAAHRIAIHERICARAMKAESKRAQANFDAAEVRRKNIAHENGMRTVDLRNLQRKSGFQ